MNDLPLSLKSLQEAVRDFLIGPGEEIPIAEIPRLIRRVMNQAHAQSAALGGPSLEGVDSPEIEERLSRTVTEAVKLWDRASGRRRGGGVFFQGSENHLTDTRNRLEACGVEIEGTHGMDLISYRRPDGTLLYFSPSTPHPLIELVAHAVRFPTVRIDRQPDAITWFYVDRAVPQVYECEGNEFGPLFRAAVVELAYRKDRRRREEEAGKR